MTVFPNPASGTEELIIRFGETVQGDILIQLYKLTGDVVYQQHVEKSSVVLEYRIVLKSFSRGVYLLRAENRGLETTQKVIIE